MDFDKQYGSGAPANMVNKGRGFVEKPMIMPAVGHRQSRARPAPRKITPNTKFVISSGRNAPRRMLSSRNNGSMGSRNSRNGSGSFQMKSFHKSNSNQRDMGRNFRPRNRGPRRDNRRNDNRRKPVTENEMDQQLNKYFEKDEDVMKQRLDNELQQYCQQGQAMSQVMETPMNQPMMSEGQPMQQTSM